VTADPAKVTTLVTYNGDTNAPTNADSRAMTATIINPNDPAVRPYAQVIAQAAHTITFAALPLSVMGETPFALTATVSSDLPIRMPAFNQWSNKGN
jgi:hypothetical protein